MLSILKVAGKYLFPICSSFFGETIFFTSDDKLKKIKEVLGGPNRPTRPLYWKHNHVYGQPNDMQLYIRIC